MYSVSSCDFKTSNSNCHSHQKKILNYRQDKKKQKNLTRFLSHSKPILPMTFQQELTDFLFLEVNATANRTKASTICMQLWKLRLKRRKFIKTYRRMDKQDKNPHHHNATCRFSIKNSAVE